MKVLCTRDSVYVGNSKLAVGVNELDEKTAKTLIARGLVSEYAEPTVNKVEQKSEKTDEKPADKPADKK